MFAILLLAHETHLGAAVVLIRHGYHREAAASSTGKGRKKTPQELSVEVLLHFAGTVRAFYASVAKAVHAQGRRRDDPAVQPNASMLAGSVTLGIILKRNLGPAQEVGLASRMPHIIPYKHTWNAQWFQSVPALVRHRFHILLSTCAQSHTTCPSTELQLCESYMHACFAFGSSPSQHVEYALHFLS